MKNCLTTSNFNKYRKKETRGTVGYSLSFTPYNVIIGRLIEDVGNRKPLPAIGLKLSSENHVKHLWLKFYQATQFIKNCVQLFLVDVFLVLPLENLLLRASPTHATEKQLEDSDILFLCYQISREGSLKSKPPRLMESPSEGRNHSPPNKRHPVSRGFLDSSRKK